MNWLIIIIVSILIISLLVFTIIKNLKDEKEFEQDLNNNYMKKNKHDESI